MKWSHLSSWRINVIQWLPFGASFNPFGTHTGQPYQQHCHLSNVQQSQPAVVFDSPLNWQRCSCAPQSRFQHTLFPFHKEFNRRHAGAEDWVLVCSSNQLPVAVSLPQFPETLTRTVPCWQHFSSSDVLLKGIWRWFLLVIPLRCRSAGIILVSLHDGVVEFSVIVQIHP